MKKFPKKQRRHIIKDRVEEEIKRAYKHKRLVIGIVSFIALVAIYLFKDSSSMTLRYSTFLGIMIVFYLIDHLFYIRFKLKHYIFVIMVGVLTILMSSLYFTYPQYDKAQHLIVPILICSIVFFTVNKLKLALKWKITFTVLSVIAMLGIFEILEYILDLFFNLKLQGVYIRDLTGLDKFNLILEPLDDTMVDLIFGIFGSSIYAIYAGIKYLGKRV